MMPNYVPMEMQASTVIHGWNEESLTICRYSRPSFQSLKFRQSRLPSSMPLEEVFGLAHPSLDAPLVEDKHTWRDGTAPAPSMKGKQWTAMGIMTA